MTDLDLVPNPFDWHVLAKWLAHKAQKVRYLIQVRIGGFDFILFALQQTSNIYECREVQFLKENSLSFRTLKNITKKLYYSFTHKIVQE